MKKLIVAIGALGLVGVWATMMWAQPGGFPGGPGGPGGPGFAPPQPGQVLPGFLQDRLSLTAEQKKQCEDLQKEVDSKVAKLLTAEQKKTLDEMKTGFGGPRAFGFGPASGGPGGGPGGGPPPFMGGFGGGPGARQESLRKLIDASDEEWKVIGPKLQKVVAARQVLAPDARELNDGAGGPRFMVGGFGGPGSPAGSSPGAATGERRQSAAADNAAAPARGQGPRDEPRGAGAGRAPTGPGGPGFGGPTGGNAVSQVQAELKAMLADSKSAPAEVQEKIAATRKARQKARDELEAAKKDLLRVLTAEQQTVLECLGYLD